MIGLSGAPTPCGCAGRAAARRVCRFPRCARGGDQEIVIPTATAVILSEKDLQFVIPSEARDLQFPDPLRVASVLPMPTTDLAFSRRQLRLHPLEPIADLYTGVTSDLSVRLAASSRLVRLTSKYRIERLVYYTTFSNPMDAIRAEKQIKA